MKTRKKEHKSIKIIKAAALVLFLVLLFISKRIGRIIRINKKSFEDWLNSGAQ